MRQADRAGARFAVIVGDEEWQARRVAVRDLARQQQEVIAVDELPDRLAALQREA
jgi:histidyl-tRNA synthetase